MENKISLFAHTFKFLQLALKYIGFMADMDGQLNGLIDRWVPHMCKRGYEKTVLSKKLKNKCQAPFFRDEH